MQRYTRFRFLQIFSKLFFHTNFILALIILTINTNRKKTFFAPSVKKAGLLQKKAGSVGNTFVPIN